ncbi:MAG: transcription termination/antitermination protein NusA, partial [Planktotalea sp.]
RVKDDGLLEQFGVELEDAQSMIMTARVLLGWVDPAELEVAADDEDLEDGETSEESEV